METATHVPGPWKFGRTKPIAGIDVTRGWFIQPDHKGTWLDIGEVYMTPTYDEATQEANARLIAAAPELLAACEDVVSNIDGLSKGMPANEPWGADSVHQWERRLKAAIAKATGGAA
jgi:hypothetical protein